MNGWTAKEFELAIKFHYKNETDFITKNMRIFQLLGQNIFPWLFTFSPSSDENLDPLTNDRKYTYKKFLIFFFQIFGVHFFFQIIRTDKI